MPPLVSVLTPTWQRHDYLLNRCIPSVRAQDYPSLEHIIVSDGPDDELGALIWEARSLAGNTTFWCLDDHDPAAKFGTRPRLKALEIAKGEFIAYLDDDDAYRPQHVRVLVDALTARPDVDFAYSLMSVEGAIVGADPPVFCGIGTPMIMHRRDTPARFGTWGPDGSAEDWELVERWLAAGATYVYVPVVTVDVWPSAYR